MSDPVTMMVLAGVSAAGSLAQGAQQAKAAKAAGEFNAKVAENNAILARQQGEAEEAKLRRAKAKAAGQIGAARGASGVTMEGSPLDVLADSETSAELDILNSRFAKEINMNRFNDEAKLARFKAKQQASSAMSGAVFSAVTSIAGGVVSSGFGLQNNLINPANAAVGRINPTLGNSYWGFKP